MARKPGPSPLSVATRSFWRSAHATCTMPACHPTRMTGPMLAWKTIWTPVADSALMGAARFLRPPAALSYSEQQRRHRPHTTPGRRPEMPSMGRAAKVAAIRMPLATWRCRAGGNGTPQARGCALWCTPRSRCGREPWATTKRRQRR